MTTKMTEIDPIQFGKMQATLETLSETLPEVFKKIDTLNTRLAEMEQKMSSGRGLILGLTLAAGGIGAGSHKIFDTLGKMFP